ncbi:MAG: hypothetical protein HY914_14470 [Desulfomonile tiedjei]|nr:hypothetical protein [Desulfomonile tiedjei]
MTIDKPVNELLSASQAAKLCGMCLMTFCRLLKKHQGPPWIQMPGTQKYLLDPDQVLEWNTRWRTPKEPDDA